MKNCCISILQDIGKKARAEQAGQSFALYCKSKALQLLTRSEDMGGTAR